MRKQKRLIALALFALLTLTLLVSSAYLVSASGHCCAHLDCEICENAARVKALFSALGGVAAVAAALTLLPRAHGAAALKRHISFRGGLTLVGRKVRLNN